jgi:HlyD family secretion protein
MSLDRRTKKRIGWGIGGLVILLLLFLAFRPTPMPVEAGTVTRGPLQITIDAEGVTRVVDRFQIAAPITGRLQRISAQEGDAVSPGMVLARLSPVPLDPQSATQARAAVAAAESRLAEANSRVTQARGVMEQAERTAERIRAVVREGGMSVEAGERADLDASNAARDYDAARSHAAAAASEVSAARAVLLGVSSEGAGGGLAVVNVVAPTVGRVLRVHERSERVVPAGTPLLDIGDAEALEVVVDVLSTDAVQVAPGTPMKIEQWGGEGALFGRVRQVEPAAFTRVSTLGVEEQRVNIIGDLPNAPAALGDGYRVEARIVVWEAADALRVPTSAIFQSDEGWQVFVIVDDRARLREVEIGERGVSEAQVLDGLVERESVVLFPSDELRDGSRVRAE